MGGFPRARTSVNVTILGAQVGQRAAAPWGLVAIAMSAGIFACEGNIRDRSRGVSGGRDAAVLDINLDASLLDLGTVPDDAGEGPPDAGSFDDASLPPDAGPGVTGACRDGLDNDGDGLIDLDDLGCTSAEDGTEGGLPSGTIENEWTVFEPAADTRMVYVSRSVGNDSYDGLSPEPSGGNRGPKATFSAARGLVRAGGADWLRLRRGDSWSEDLRPGTLSGRSATEPTVIAPYGAGALPRITADAYFSENNARFIALLGIDFGSGAVVANGNGVNHILIEGCRFAGTPFSAIVLSGRANLSMNTMAVRNNVINSTGDNATYFVSVTGALLEGNLIYRPATNNGSNHAMYITRTGNSGYVTRKNLIYMGKPGGMGIMQRAGGISELNVVADVGGIAIPMGECNDEGGPGAGPCFAPVQVTIRNNLIAGIRSDASAGIGIFLKDPYVASGVVEHNLVADSRRGDFQLVDEVVTNNNRRVSAPYVGAPAGATMLEAYHASLGGSGNAQQFFMEAMANLRFHDANPAYQAQAIIDFAQSKVQ
jgi:hypothetical protein